MARIIFLTDFTECYADEFMKGIVKYCRDHRPWSLYKMPRTFLDSEDMEGLLDFALKWKADAVIGQFRSTDDLSILRRKGIIVIPQDNESRFEGYCNIVGDHEDAGRICANYFILKGFKNFAFFGNSIKEWSNERQKGFREEIESRVRKYTFATREAPEYSERWMEDAVALKDWLLSLPKPVAILACNDRAAYNIVEACRLDKTGSLHIPSEVSVLGIDNDETVCLLCHPQLSSLNQNIEDAGFKAVKTIDELMKMPYEQRMRTVPDNITVHHTFITSRNSTNAFLHDNKYVNTALEYIDKHIMEDIHVEDIVKTVPVSRRLLETTVKKHLDCSIYQYIIKARVEKIKQLIRNGMTAQEALASIDVDKRTLSNCFKQATGMTPLKYELKFK